MAVDALRSLGAPITPDVMAKIFAGGAKSSAPTHKPRAGLEKVQPTNIELALLATVREIVMDSARLDAIHSLGALGLKLLGLNTKAEYAQVTLVVTSEMPNRSYTGIILRSVARTLSRDRIVMAQIEGRQVGTFAAWIVQEANEL